MTESLIPQMRQGLDDEAGPFAAVLPGYSEELREDSRVIRLPATYVWGPFVSHRQAATFAAFVTAEVDPAHVEQWTAAVSRPGVRHLDPVEELLNWRRNALELAAGGALPVSPRHEPEIGPVAHLPLVMFAPCGRAQPHSRHTWNNGREWTCSGHPPTPDDLFIDADETGSLALDNDDQHDGAQDPPAPDTRYCNRGILAAGVLHGKHVWTSGDGRTYECQGLGQP